jgi:type I restriction enzyme S subunit
MAPNRALMSDRRDRVGEKSHEYTLLSLTLGGVIPRDMDNPKGKFPAQFNTYKVVRPNDFVFCLFDIDETPRGVGLSNHAGMITGAYDVFSPTHRVNPRFLYYYYLFVDQGKLMKPFYVGLRKTIQRGTFAGIKAPLPPTAEQAAIVRFLDHWNGRLEKAIRAKRRVIALLQEQKQAIIHRAVTRGLDPNVKLKDSGISWLGEIPEHWEVRRMKRVGQVKIGLTYSPGEMTDESGMLVLRASNVRNGRIVPADNVYVSKKVPAALLVCEGDILICVRSGSRNLVGKAALITKEFAGVTYGAFMSLLRSDISPFLFWVLNSNLFSCVMAEFETSTINQLTQSDLKNLLVPIPPEEEQSKIVEYLKSATSEVDRAIARYEREITLLREYRTRLTADVVTGNLDVRTAAAQLPDPGEALAEAENFEEEPELEEVEG